MPRIPKTGTARIVKILETVQEIPSPDYVEEKAPAPPKPKIFFRHSDEDLLSYGIPEEWCNDLTEDTILEIAELKDSSWTTCFACLAANFFPNFLPITFLSELPRLLHDDIPSELVHPSVLRPKDSDFSRSYVTWSGEFIPLQKIGRSVSRQRKITAICYPSQTVRKHKNDGYNLLVF